MVLYICDICKKTFNRKQTYDYHINRKYSCKLNNKTEILEDENIILKKENQELKLRNVILEEENKKITELYNNLLDKSLKNNHNTNCNNTTNNTTNNTNNTTNNTTNNNTVNINLVPFGLENVDDLTFEEKEAILKAGELCTIFCTRFLNCNPRLPQYHNINLTNLRSNDAKIYDKDNTWKTIDKDDLFHTSIIYRTEDVRKIINDDNIKVTPYTQSLLEKGVDDEHILQNKTIKNRFYRTIYDFTSNKKTLL